MPVASTKANLLGASGAGLVGVHVGSFTKQAGTGNQDITLPTGCPDLTAAAAGSWAIMFWTAGSDQASGTWDAHPQTTLGFVANGGGSISQYAVGTWHIDAAATTDTGRRMAAKAITIDWFNTTAEAEFSSFPTATTMRLNWTTPSSFGTTAHVINFVIFTGLTNAKVVNWTTPTSAGSKAVTGVGFSPDLVLHASAYATSLPQSNANALVSFGAMNKHGQQWANSFTSNDNLADSNTSRWQQTDAAFIAVNAGEVQAAEAHFSSMDTDGFTTYFSTPTSTGFHVFSLCMDGISSKLGAYVATGTSQEVASRHGFSPRGLLLSNVGGGAAAAPATNAFWNLGVTDLTNSRMAHLFDADGSATTVAKSVWRNNALSVLPNATSTPSDFSVTTFSSADEDSFAVAHTVSPGVESLYLLVGDAGTDTFPASVLPSNMLGDSTTGAATAYSNQKKALTLSTGRQVVVVANGAFTHGNFYRSDDGQTWTRYSGGSEHIAGWSNGSIASYVDSGGTERLVAVWVQSGTGGGRTSGEIYVMVGTFNADRTTLTWGTAMLMGNASGWGGYNYPDIVVTPEGTGGVAHVVAGTYTGGNVHLWRAEHAISSTGTQSSTGGIAVVNGVAGGGYPFASFDIDPVTKRLFLAWTMGMTGAGKGVRFRTAAYSAGTWTWAIEVEVDTGHYIDSTSRWLNCRWDGTRVVIGGYLLDGTNGDLMQYESTNFTSFPTTYTHVNNAGTTERMNAGSMAVDLATGDVYFFGGDAETVNTFRYRKWTRSGTSLGSVVVLDTTGTQQFANAWYWGNKVRWIYTAGNNSPYAVKYDELSTV